MKNLIKILILATLAISLATLYSPLLQNWLPLSWQGIKHFHLWQLVSYLFITPGSLSLGFLLQLAFNLFVLWIFGTTIIERSRPTIFLSLYLGAGIFSALCSLAPLAYSSTILVGNISAIYALMVAWMMMNPGAQLLLFFTLPFKAHWLILGLIGVSLFIDLSDANWVGAVSLLSSVIYGYVFSLIVWKMTGPFLFLRSFERKLLLLLESPSKKIYRHSSKIYDIHSGKPVSDDDQFMDEMLAKINSKGEASLTAEEKKRMHEISVRKASQKK